MRPKFQRPDVPCVRANRTSFDRKVIFRTDEDWVNALGYLLGVALKELDLELYGGCFFFTHGHFDVGHPLEDSPEVLPRFSLLWEKLNHWIWRLLVANAGWSGPAFCCRERTYEAPVLDAEEVWRGLVYDTAQPVKAGLFKRTRDYPGLGFLPEDVLKPRVFHRNELIERMDPHGYFQAESVSIQLSVPRVFRHLSRAEYAEIFAQKLEEYEDAVGPTKVVRREKVIQRCNSIKLGTRFTKRVKSRLTRVPPQNTLGHQPVHCRDERLKKAYKDLRKEFWDTHKTSYGDLSSGKRDVKFPAGSFGWRRRFGQPVSPATPAPWAGQEKWYPT